MQSFAARARRTSGVLYFCDCTGTPSDAGMEGRGRGLLFSLLPFLSADFNSATSLRAIHWARQLQQSNALAKTGKCSLLAETVFALAFACNTTICNYQTRAPRAFACTTSVCVHHGRLHATRAFAHKRVHHERLHAPRAFACNTRVCTQTRAPRAVACTTSVCVHHGRLHAPRAFAHTAELRPLPGCLTQTAVILLGTRSRKVTDGEFAHKGARAGPGRC